MPDDLFAAFAARLNGAGHGQKGSILAEAEELTGLSRPALYKRLKAAGYTTGRKRRADAGESKVGLNQDHLALIAGVQHLSKRKNKRVIMPTGTAVEILQRAGQIPAEVSLSTVQRHLYRSGLSRAQMEASWTTDDHQTPTFHTHLQSKSPNDLHLFDITPCVQYFFGPRGLKQRDKNMELYGTKVKEYQKIKGHLHRYVLIDHCTSAFFVKYYYSKGENAADVINFLWSAWSGEGRDVKQYPFRGAPKRLMLDRGAANLSGYVQTLMDNLGVEMIVHKPGNPRAKGAVEGTMQHWEGWFESRLALKPAPDLETLNAWTIDFLTHANAAKRHRRHGHTRSALWASRIRPEQLRIPPSWEVFQVLAHSKPEIRKVGRDGIVKYKGNDYLILDPVNIFDRLEVSHNPYDYPAIRAFLLAPDGSRPEIRTQILHKDELGYYEDHGAVLGEEYSRQADAPTQQALKQMDQLDYAEAAAAAFGGWSDDLQVNYLQRRGTEIEIDQPEIEPATVDKIEGLQLILAMTGRDSLTVLQNTRINQILGPAPWSRDAVEDLARQMITTDEPPEAYAEAAGGQK